MNFIHSNEIRCRYCQGSTHSERFATLTDSQYMLMLENNNYARNDLFCEVCIGRMDAKLNRRRRRVQSLDPHGTTSGTTLSAHRSQLENSRPGTAKSQSRTSPRKRRREHDENSPPDNEDQPQPGPSHQIRPPPRRQFAAKSTAGRLQTKDSPANTSGRQASAPAQNTSTQSNTDTQSIPRPGTSGAQAQNSSEQSAQENSSSELIPPYSQARPESPPQSPQRSLSPPSRNLSQMASPSTPDRSPMGAPTAPIPRNRPMRNETPGRPSPPRPNESASGYRQRMADAHRTYNRGTAG